MNRHSESMEEMDKVYLSKTILENAQNCFQIRFSFVLLDLYMY